MLPGTHELAYKTAHMRSAAAHAGVAFDNATATMCKGGVLLTLAVTGR